MPRSRAESIGWFSVVTMLMFGSCVFYPETFAGDRHASEVIDPTVILSGHSDGVHAIAFVPNDSHRLVSASHDGTLKLWNLETGACVHTYHGHEKSVNALAVSADGKKIASASDDGTARLWDLESEDQVAQYEGHGREVTGISFLPENRLLTTGRDGRLRIWNVTSEELIWTSAKDHGICCAAVTPDGTRAVCGEVSGVTAVWDLVKGRRIVVVGEPTRYFVDSVAITPDGKRVYVVTHDENAGVYSVDGGEKIFDPAFPRGSMGLSVDGKLVATESSVTSAGDAKRMHSLHRFSLSPRSCFAFTKDHRRLAIGGAGFESVSGWIPDKANVVEIHDLPDVNEKPIPGRMSGAISWDVEAFKIMTPEGASERLDDASRVGQWNILSIPADGDRQAMDVFATSNSVFMQREKGILQKVLYDRDANFSSLTWDGLHLWVGSKENGIRVISTDGKAIAMIDANQGLPPATRTLLMHAVARDRVLVTGFDDREGWCALIEKKGNGSQYQLRRVVDEKSLPAGWKERHGNDTLNGPGLRPRFMTEPPAGAGKRSVWIGCEGVPRSPTPILRIDARTLAVTAYNLAPANLEPKQAESHRPMNLASVEGWLGPDRLLGRNHELSLAELVVGPEILDAADTELLCDARVPEGKPPVLRFDGKYYLPGAVWHRLDPSTKVVTQMGPGVRVEGKPVDAWPSAMSGDIAYFVSARWGMSAISAVDHAVYRLSADPAHFRSDRGTLDAVEPTVPVPNEGRVMFGPDRAAFERGGGLLKFEANVLKVFPHGSSAVRESERRAGITLKDCDELRTRLREYPGEVRRLGVTDAQKAQLQALRISWAEANVPKLTQLYRAFRKAEPGPARADAARPILDEAAALGEKWGAAVDVYLAAHRSIITERQWKLARYEAME